MRGVDVDITLQGYVLDKDIIPTPGHERILSLHVASAQARSESLTARSGGSRLPGNHAGYLPHTSRLSGFLRTRINFYRPTPMKEFVIATSERYRPTATGPPL